MTPKLGRSPGGGHGDHCSIVLAWRIPWTEEPGELQSMGLQRIRHDRATNTHTYKKCANTGSAKPCLHPILPDFPTGKATTLEDLNVISTQLFIFLKLVLLGERRQEDGQVLLDGHFTFSGNLIIF